MTLIDYFKAFHSLKETLKLSAGSQAVYFSILGEFNAARFPERLSISTRELQALAGLKSTNAVIENRNVLKNKKLIDFQTKNGVTTYSLATEHLLNTNRTHAEQLLNSETNPNIRVRDKTEDLKTLDSIPSVHSAGACENFSGEQQLIDLWLANNGAAVSFELLSYLKVLVERHGLDFTESAIRETATSYGGDFRISLKYFRSCVERKLKGGDRNALRLDRQSRGNRSNVLAFAGGRTASDSDAIPSSGKGRFDDDAPDYSWLKESCASD